MRGKIAFMIVITTMLVVMTAVPAQAAQVTKILRAWNSADTYSFTPAATGTMDATISWTLPNGTGAPVYPVAEVDGVVQTYDSVSGEDYMDIDAAGMYAGTNPQTGSYTVRASGVNKPIYITVLPWVNDVPYRLVVTFGGATVIDTGAINIASPTQKWAYASAGEFQLPATAAGNYHSVQVWPGTKPVTPPSNVTSNWDDYSWGRDDWNNVLTNNYSVEYVGPVVTDHTIAQNEKGLWWLNGPQMWTSAVVPNVWANYATDVYAKPGSVTSATGQMWETYAWPDTTAAEKPTYFWGALNNAASYGHAFSAIGDRSAKITTTINGTAFDVIYVSAPNGGVAKMTIDKGLPSQQILTKDMYSPANTTKQVWSVIGLAAGQHTIEITSNATRNPASRGFWTYVDRIAGKSDAADPTPWAETNTDGVMSQEWGRINYASASGGNFSASADRASAAAFTWAGTTSITWHYVKSSSYGVARVYVDGVDKGTVDLYASAAAVGSQAFTGVGTGQHTIMIVSDRTRNGASTGYWFSIDKFVYGTTTVEN